MFDVREHDAHTTIMKATMHHYKGKQTTSYTNSTPRTPLVEELMSPPPPTVRSG